jgi:dienelactone hydrolase
VFSAAAMACNNARAIRSEALQRSSAVTFTTSDGVQLAGRLFGPEHAVNGIVFSHMLPADQSSWYELASSYGSQGYRALTFDFRGYCPGGDAGCSQGSKDPSAAANDLSAAVEYLRSQGVHRLALIGASMGGTASLVVSGQDAEGVRAVITLSAPAQIEDLAAGPDLLQTITAAKLFIAGSGDGIAGATALAFYDQSPQPKAVKVLPSNDHGTALLEGNQSEETRKLIDDWLQRYLPLG